LESHAVLWNGLFFGGLHVLTNIAAYALPLLTIAVVIGAAYLIRQTVPGSKYLLLQTVLTFLVFLMLMLENRFHLHIFNPAILYPVLTLAWLLINLAIVAAWLHHLVEQRKIAARKRLSREQEQQAEVARQTAALHRALESADKKSRQKTEILGYIGHDLRAPLTTIKGYMKLMKGEEHIPDALHIRAIERSIDYQMALIDELLNYAKTELEPLTLSPAPVYTCRLLDDIAHHAQGLALQNNNQIQFTVSQPLPELVLLDGRRLKQALLNLLSNAAKFTREGFIFLDIQASQAELNWNMRFAVIDSGVGIADNQQAAIFKPFQQAHPQDEGMGLGLFISRNIVHSMGSELQLHSTPEHGSIFSFQLTVESLNHEVATWNPPSPLPTHTQAHDPEQDGQICLSGPSSLELPEHSRIELALMARGGHVTDIEKWLADMSRQYPSHAKLFDDIKTALYSLDLKKIESLASRQS